VTLQHWAHVLLLEVATEHGRLLRLRVSS
jgi:hypothetical protein